MRKNLRMGTAATLLRALTSSLLLLGVVGCGDGESRPLKSYGLKSAPVELSAEQERIARQQHVVLVTEDGKTWEVGELRNSRTPANQDPLTKMIVAQCESALKKLEAGDDFACGKSKYDVQWNACMAGFYMAGTSEDPGVVTLGGGTPLNPGPLYRYGVQSVTASAALARAAAGLYQESIGVAWRILNSPDASSPTSCDLADLSAKDVAEITAQLVQYVKRGQEALDTVQRLTLAAADKQFASTSALDEATRRAYTAQDLSRAASARYLTSRYFPDEDLALGDIQAYCKTSELSPQASSALALFRQVGMHPADVVNDVIETASLVDYPLASAGSGSAPQSGSLRQRLIWQKTMSDASLKSVEEEYSLSADAFEEARKYLAQELVTFDRVLRPKGLPLPPGETDPSHARFANTVNVPSDRSFAFYTALIDSHAYDKFAADNWPRYGNDWQDGIGPLCPGLLCVGNPALPDSGNSGDGLYNARIVSMSAFRASVQSMTRSLLGRFTDPSAPSRPGFEAPDVVGPLGLLAQDPELEGVLTICSDISTVNMDVMISGGAHFGEARLLNYATDLDCAVNGTIEGQPCVFGATTGAVLTFSTDAWQSARAQALGYEPTDVIGAVNAAHYGYPETVRPRMYLVVPKYPQEPARRGPGDWRAVAGLAAYLPSNGCTGNVPTCQPVTRCRDVPLIPSLGEEVKKIIAPSPDNCGRPKTSCTGIDFDARMPLENELSDDKDGVENSWKYYLSMADAAAREADQLGQEYLSASLASDQFEYSVELWKIGQQEKAIGAMDRVQSICGTAIEPEALLATLDSSSHTAGGTRLDNVVSPGGCAALEPGESCIANKRVKNLNSTIAMHPDLAKLNECLGTVQSTNATTYSAVHLGNGALCAWELDGKLCAGAGSDPGEVPIDCPFVGEICAVPTAISSKQGYAGATAVLITEGLGLFDAEATAGAPANPAACAAIRRLTLHEKDDEGGYQRDLMLLRRWKGLSKETLKRYASLITYTLEPEDHITVYLDNKKWFSTHDSQSWPCGTQASYGSGCSSSNNGTNHFNLFCGWHDCSNSNVRSRIVNEFSKQIDLLKATTWEGSEPIPTGIRRSYYRLGGAEHFPGGPVGNYLLNCTEETVDGELVYACPIENSTVYARNGANGANPKIMTLPSGWINKPPFSGQIPAGQQANMTYPAPGAMGAVANYYAHETYNVLGPYGTGNRENPTSFFAEFWAGFDESFDTTAPGVVYRHFAEGAAKQFPKSWQAIQLDEMRLSVTEEGFVPMSHGGFIAGIQADQMYLAELVCEAEIRHNHVGGGCDESELAGIKTLDDADKAGRVLECLGDALIRRAATATFTEVPRNIADPLRKQAGANVFDISGGELAEQYGQLRMALAQVAVAGPAVGQAVKAVGSDIRQLELSGERAQIERKMDEIQFEATRAQQIANCVQATAQIANSIGTPKAVIKALVSSVSAAATCVNSYAQIDFANQLRRLADTKIKVELEMEINDFQRKFDDHIYQFQTLSLELQRNLEGVGTALEKIESLRFEAQREIANAVWYLSNPASALQLEGELVARSDLSRIRYERATLAARRLAFLAKRAIETRIGTPLREMREDMPLVAAPSTWESTICATNGVDLTDIESADSKTLAKIADESVLSYVKKLSNIVESYRLMNGFHEGIDTAVVSLRDDIHNVRVGCLVPSNNLLKSPGDLTLGESGSTTSTWTPEGCSSQGLPNCVAAKRGEPIAALAAGQDVNRIPVEHVLAFGTADLPTQANPSPVPPGCEVGTAATCGWIPGARLVQRVALEPGTYRFSWYGTQTVENGSVTTAVPTGGISTTNPVSISGPGIVLGPNGNPVSADRAWFEDIPGGKYQHRAIVFTVIEAGQYQIGFAALSSVDGQYQYKIAGPMLERERLRGTALGDSPGAYEDGGKGGQVFRMSCEDRDGSSFRINNWHHNCEYVCPSGNKSDCTEALVERCYWESEFYISQRRIERGEAMLLSGFARGNYNYRIEEIGLNFVGTGTRDCSTSSTPSTCYGAGFIPYTLTQRGPFYVRNERGIDYQFDLFPGRIEHARGLSTERYLTNPLSNADSELMASYMRQELRGRPLDGNFAIRVWDEPGVAFNAIEDVQLVMKYRYWTLGN